MMKPIKPSVNAGFDLDLDLQGSLDEARCDPENPKIL
jgi:hypothetical protein